MRDAKNVVFSIGTDNIERSSAGLSRKLAIFDLEMQNIMIMLFLILYF